MKWLLFIFEWLPFFFLYSLQFTFCLQLFLSSFSSSSSCIYCLRGLTVFQQCLICRKKKLEVGRQCLCSERESGNEIPLQKIFFSFVHRYTHIFSLSSTLLLSHYLFFLFLFLSLSCFLFVCLFVGLFFFFFSSPLENLFSLHIYIHFTSYIYSILYYIILRGYYSSFSLFERVFCYTI